MGTHDAEKFVGSLRIPEREWVCRGWADKRHIATSSFRKGVLLKLSRDQHIHTDGSIALVEIFLKEDLPEIDKFEGIFDVDELGIWYYDGDGNINESIWRQRVIPWQYVTGITLHQTS